MARPRAKLDVFNQQEEVAKLLSKLPAGFKRERILAVSKGLKGEQSLADIAEDLGRSRATIQTWFNLYRQGGIEKLCEQSKAPRGPKSWLYPEAKKELQKKLAKGSFRRAIEAQGWLEKQFGIVANIKTVRRWLGKCGARLKVPRPAHPNSSPSKRREFKEKFARMAFKALKEHRPDFRDRPIRLWVMDEARVGLHPTLRRAWGLKGCRIHKSNLRRFEWQYVWAALQVGGGGSEFLYTNKADSDLSCEFMKQISERDPYAIHIVMWDGAGFHPPADDPRMPSNVITIKQPPYSPELNAVEKLWDMMRDDLCNRQWSDLDELLDRLTQFLEEFWNEPKKIYSLIGDGWHTLQANTCSAPLIPIKP